MRNFVIACLLVVVSSFKTNAMRVYKPRPFGLVQVMAAPKPISFIQFPTKDFLVFDGFFRSKNLRMKKNERYKDIVLKSNLKVRGQTGYRKFFNAIHRAFDKPCRCMKGWCRMGIIYPQYAFNSQVQVPSMRPKSSKEEIEFFFVKIHDLNIIRFPESEEIIFDGVRTNKTLKVAQGSDCKGVHFYNDLNLYSNMTNSIFLKSICDAVNQPCKFIEGFYRFVRHQE
jgi:hypothetical protein